MEMLLHPPEDPERHRPDRRGRLSTVGHAAAFRALARVARRANVRFMVIGGTFRDVAIRAASTRDIDIVLVDCDGLPPAEMSAAGFRRVPGSSHAWRHLQSGRVVDVEVAAVASSADGRGPFSVAFRNAETRKIEGLKAAVPRVEDYVILKLLAATSDRRRFYRDATDIQHALEAFSDTPALALPAIRARMRDVFGVTGPKLKELVSTLRGIARSR